uniref:Proteasome 26S subunit ubiquitin receptor, non-ATPase 4 n=1 Tax=Oncorhynchus kisutch TaxID=8019 RepID=A0A8C7H7F0_ONCKI
MFFSQTHLCPSLIASVDNSEYMRNGDFLPTRLQAQQDAVNIVCHSKTRANPENNVGLISMANCLTELPKGKICFCTGIRVAHLALKHRQGKNHKMRIIAFIGSPVEDNDKDVGLPLTITSSIIVSLASVCPSTQALRVSMEEQRQEEEARRVAVASAADVTKSEDALLKINMTEEEQIAYAMQMSLAGEDVMAMDTGAPMDTETAKEDDDYDVMQDPEYLQSVLENLPGVDPNNEAIRNAMGSLASQTGPPKPDSKKDEEKKEWGQTD